MRAVERGLRVRSPGCSATARLGAVVFIHRFGSALNAHLQFHCCIVDGVFEAGHAADHDPRWAPAAQPLPEIECDQRLTW